MEHLTDDAIIDYALEPQTTASAVAEHLGSCEQCAREVAAYRHLIDVGRESAEDHGPSSPPPPEVWSAISRELGLRDTSEPEPGRAFMNTRPESLDPGAPADAATPSAPSEGARVPRRWPRSWLVAAAVLITVLAVGVGVLIGRSLAPPAQTASPTSSAQLTPVDTGPPRASGAATITGGPTGATLSVTTRQLPLRQGFYQVWLYDQSSGVMVPIGTLDAVGNGTFSVAPSIDIHTFNIVDVSAQQLNGDPAHGTSMLRGTLTQ